MLIAMLSALNLRLLDTIHEDGGMRRYCHIRSFPDQIGVFSEDFS